MFAFQLLYLLNKLHFFLEYLTTSDFGFDEPDGLGRFNFIQRVLIKT